MTDYDGPPDVRRRLAYVVHPSALTIDYTTLILPAARVSLFTLQAGRMRSHYLLTLDKEQEFQGDELHAFVHKHLAHAQHVRTCNGPTR